MQLYALKNNRSVRRIFKLFSNPLPLTMKKVAKKSQTRLNEISEYIKFKISKDILSEDEFLKILGNNSPETLKLNLNKISSQFWKIYNDRIEPENSITFRQKETQIIETAEKVCEHKFNLLGSGDVKVCYQLKANGFEKYLYHEVIGDKEITKNILRFREFTEKLELSTSYFDKYDLIDWHTDFRSGYRWNKKTWYKWIRYGHVPGADIKVPWELSRFQHLTDLGRAYHTAGDEKYVFEFTCQITDWLMNNPPKFGINWACTMEVAIRSLNWILGSYFFVSSDKISDKFWMKFFNGLFLHGRHIRSNLEIDYDAQGNRIAANHYIANIVGLIFLGALFRDIEEGKGWLKFGVAQLISEMELQIYPDGVHFEASTSYHRMVTELILIATLICIENGIQFPDQYFDKLEKMIEFILYYTKPDGTTPLIGDNDNTNLPIFRWSEDPLDSNYLSILLFRELLIKKIDTEKILGEAGEIKTLVQSNTEFCNSHYSKIKDYPDSKSFPNGGIYILRKHNSYMIVDCGLNGQNGEGGHAHNDTLSFELTARGINFIIDPGTYVYTADEKLRNLFRSTAYHNVIAVDEEEMNRIEEGELFYLQEDAKPKVNLFEVEKSYDYLDSQHSGYQRLASPVIHRRQMLFNKQAHYWLIKDILSGKSIHQYCLYLHFAPMDVDLVENDHLVIGKKNGINLLIFPYYREKINLRKEKGWISPSYGRKIRAPVIIYSAKGSAPVTFLTVFYPSNDYQYSLDCIRENINSFCKHIDKNFLLEKQTF
jgi:hypothetical protein